MSKRTRTPQGPDFRVFRVETGTERGWGAWAPYLDGVKECAGDLADCRGDCTWQPVICGLMDRSTAPAQVCRGRFPPHTGPGVSGGQSNCGSEQLQEEKSCDCVASAGVPSSFHDGVVVFGLVFYPQVKAQRMRKSEDVKQPHRYTSPIVKILFCVCMHHWKPISELVFDHPSIWWMDFWLRHSEA